jgi:glycosyltransferase involved in cell wall biosynthesis
MTGQFPRMLVVTECPPNSAGGGAAVIRQMLKDWPAENLFWWSCRPDRDQHFGRQVAAHHVARIPPKLYPHRRWCAQKSWLLEHAWTPWATRHFRNTLAGLEPEVVWVIPHCWAIPPAAQVLPRSKTSFHVSIHDYADVRANTPKFGQSRSRNLAGLAENLYASATTRDAISQPMLDDLRARTGCDGPVVRAGLEREDFDYLSAKTGARMDAIRIAYAGTILAEKEFALFARALARIRGRLPLPLTLDLFGDHSYRSRDWFDAGWMRERGNLPAAQLSQALRECAWGFSPMELADDNPRYNRFSLPTKFVSYLAAGLPIITLGHPESSAVKIASQYAVGLCLTTGDVEELSARLLAVLSEPDPKPKHRAEIRRCASVEFDAGRMRAALYENFQKCAGLNAATSDRDRRRIGRALPSLHRKERGCPEDE